LRRDRLPLRPAAARRAIIGLENCGAIPRAFANFCVPAYRRTAQRACFINMNENHRSFAPMMG
jgi:hypothetical protein